MPTKNIYRKLAKQIEPFGPYLDRVIVLVWLLSLPLIYVLGVTIGVEDAVGIGGKISFSCFGVLIVIKMCASEIVPDRDPKNFSTR